MAGAPPEEKSYLQIQDEKDCDLFVFSGPINDEDVELFWDGVETQKKRPNIALVLTTFGGSADAAYRIASRLLEAYEKFTLYVFGPCKSAGTLIACGANEIVMSCRGELGPLDVQLAKEDDLLRRSSGLAISNALDFINRQSVQMFEGHFLNLIEKSVGQLSTKTTSEIAKTITVGLLAPITQQIDPMQVGEMHRAMSIAFEYGKRLGIDAPILRKLVTDYPSHEFVIDYKEASGLFKFVRRPTDAERRFEKSLAQAMRDKYQRNFLLEPSSQVIFFALEPEQQIENKTNDDAPVSPLASATEGAADSSDASPRADSVPESNGQKANGSADPVEGSTDSGTRDQKVDMLLS